MSKLILFITVVLSFTASAQPELLWMNTYMDSIYSIPASIVQTEDGGYLIGGHGVPLDSVITDGLLFATDADGDSLWSRYYSMIYRGQTITNCIAGGYAFVGYTSANWDDECFIMVVDANGDSLWSSSYSGAPSEIYSIIQTDDGGYAIVGNFGSYGPPYTELLRLDQNGDSLWYAPFGSDDERGLDWCFNGIQTSDGRFALVGHIVDPVQFYRSYALMMLDENGDSLWSQTYRLRDDEQCHYIMETEDDGFALAGLAHPEDVMAPRQNWFVRVDSEGDSLWSRIYNHRLHDIIQTHDGGFLQATEFNTLLRTDDQGDSLWTMNIELEPYFNVIYTCMQTSEGGYALAGKASGGGILLIKTGRDPVSVPAESDQMQPDELTLMPAYPNPFNKTTTFVFDLPSQQYVSLNLYDQNGRLVNAFVDDRLVAARYSSVWNAELHAAGVYFFRLQAGSFQQTKKVTLLK